MARPTVIPLSSIVCALSEEPQSASAVAAKVGASRATVHRKLVELAEKGLVVHGGAGKSSTYRLASPEEEVSRVRSSQPQKELVRLHMNGKMAGALRESLEIMTRIAIGQIEEITHQMRWEAFGPEKRFTIEQIDSAGSRIKALKHLMLDLPENASHGIFSTHNHPDIRLCWELNRIIRHRLAWDRTPSGAMGVDFDEPFSDDANIGAMFTRIKAADDEQKEKGYVLEVSFDLAKLLIRSLRLQSRLVSGDIAVVVDFAAEGMMRNSKGEQIASQTLAAALTIAHDASRILNFASGEKTLLAKSYEAVAEVIESTVSDNSPSVPQNDFVHEIDLNKGWRLSASAATSSQLNDDIVGLKDLPEGHFVRHERGSYRVIGPCDDPNYLSVLSESHSVQTAILKALNKINHVARAF